MTTKYKEFDYYPDKYEVDNWLDDIYNTAVNTRYDVEFLDIGLPWDKIGTRHIKEAKYIKFIPAGREAFYCYWQPSQFGNAPLLVHTPGGGAEMSMHPDLVMQGYNVIHISPLGYMTPYGVNERLRGSSFLPPCLAETITTKAQGGFKQWLIDCCIAIEWARKQNKVISDRFAFFGTSQGGMGSLLLGSLYSDKGVKCIAAEEPFATNFPMNKALDESPGYKIVFDMIDELENPSEGWYALGFLDSLSHLHRLTFPVFLAAGGNDILCPHRSIMSVYEKISSSKVFYYMEGLNHDYSLQFITMISSWFKLYL